MRIEIVKIQVIFDGLVKSDDGRIRMYYHNILVRPDGRKKTVSATAIVADKELLKKLSDLASGSEIKIETAADWDAEGIPVFLVGFEKCGNSEKVITQTNKSATGELVAT